MERLDKLVNLQILDLSDNLLKKIEGIESLHKLTVLNVEDNLIESIPAFLGKKLKCLKRLKLARNRLQPVCIIILYFNSFNPFDLFFS